MSSFENTCRVMQDRLNLRLRDGFRRLWVQGSSTGRGNVTLVVTYFRNDGSYSMKFIDIKNFRNYKLEPKSDETWDQCVEREDRLIDDYISRLRPSLEEFIEY